ncbi:MAG: hypothetical protein Q8K75_05160 [Chlamydiales bacterium]|nr:hypothetical protein [Chlamydiales bacterium]
METLETLRAHASSSSSSSSASCVESQIPVDQVPLELRESIYGVQTPEHEASLKKLNDVLATTLQGDYEQLCYTVLFDKGRPGFFASVKDPVNLIRRANHGDFAVMLGGYEADQVDKFRGPPGNPNLVFGVADPAFHSMREYAFKAVSLSNEIDMGLHQIEFFADLASNAKVSNAWDSIKCRFDSGMTKAFDLYVEHHLQGDLSEGLRAMPAAFFKPEWVPLKTWPKIYSAIARELRSSEVPPEVLAVINNVLENPKGKKEQEAFLDITIKHKANRLRELALEKAETLETNKAIVVSMDRLSFAENKRRFAAFTEIVRPYLTTPEGQQILDKAKGYE